MYNNHAEHEINFTLLFFFLSLLIVVEVGGLLMILVLFTYAVFPAL